MQNNYSQYSNNGFNAIIDVINQGVNILRNNISAPINYSIVQAWQNYAKFVLKIYASSNSYLEYLNFLTAIIYLPPQEQLNRSINKLLELARRI